MEETAQAIRPMSEKLNEGTVVGAVGVGDMGGGIASAILRHYPISLAYIFLLIHNIINSVNISYNIPDFN